jgi:hypothetical protein
LKKNFSPKNTDDGWFVPKQTENTAGQLIQDRSSRLFGFISMTYHQELLQSCPPPADNMFGRKRDGLDLRIREAENLAGLMRSRRPFCFLRMGDMELIYLLSHQNGRTESLEYGDGPLSGTQGVGNPGLGSSHSERLWKAYAGADYVDFHEKNWPNEHLVPRLKLNRPPGAARNPDKETSLVFLTWTEKELKNYGQGRRIGFAGAEARLLQLLADAPEFRKAAVDFWPEGADVFFHQARNDGRNLDANLDLVKEDLRAFVSENRVDTLFISLGGGAKIIGFELSRELGICCFDFGAMTRALTYSGCDGNRVARSPHYPFFFRIPFDVYMDALEKAMPNLTPAELLAKAHGQLILEVVKKETGWTFASWEYDFSEENRAFFKKAYGFYRKRYHHLFNASPEAKKERNSFLHFCGTHGLTMEGQLFLARFHAKGFARRLLGGGS